MSHALARTSFQFAAARFALGFGEAANFPGGDQNGRGLVPEAGARTCHGNLQQRIESGSDCRAAARSLCRFAFRVACFIPRNRWTGCYLADALVKHLSGARRKQMAL